MNIDAALSKLFSLHTFGMKLGLDNIRKFLNIIDNPQKKIKTIHIAGSNGKGSTASFIASILMESDFKVGLYTSPHFIKFNERIAINNARISDEYVASFVEKYSENIDAFKLTFFEVTTAIAFNYFADQRVDFAIVETGLGGRLDATNCLNPEGVLITSISLEHTKILGDTIEQIAFEKASIIKNKSKVFIGILPLAAERVIETKCKKTHSLLFRLRDYVKEGINSVELVTAKFELNDGIVPLKGDYQKYNAALATLAVSKILSNVKFDLIESGVKNVIKNTGLQGRYEYYSNNPDIIFDSAHNIEGVKNFLSEYKKDLMKYEKKILLFGVSKDKPIKKMLRSLKKYFDEVHITEVNYERSAKIEDLQAIADEINLKAIPEISPVKYIEKFKGMGKENSLVVLGSMYLLGEIKTLLQNNKNFLTLFSI